MDAATPPSAAAEPSWPRGPMSSAMTIALILVLAVLFGAAMSWLKGNGSGFRDAIGNASAPWLLVPFLAGAATGSRRLITGAVVGLAATLAALAGFYVANSVVLDLGPHPWLTDLALTVRGGVYWAERAVLTGPVFGALGGWWRRDRSLAAAATIAAMFVLEPAAWWLYNLRLHGGAAYAVPQYPALWLGEIAVGFAAFALLRARRGTSSTASAAGPAAPGRR
jgi:Family of unknown function (DUF6518)